MSNNQKRERNKVKNKYERCYNKEKNLTDIRTTIFGNFFFQKRTCSKNK